MEREIEDIAGEMKGSEAWESIELRGEVFGVKKSSSSSSSEEDSE